VFCLITDVDECAMGTSDCDKASSTCVNTLGSYKCRCNKGYQENLDRCEGTALKPCLYDETSL